MKYHIIGTFGVIAITATTATGTSSPGENSPHYTKLSGWTTDVTGVGTPPGQSAKGYAVGKDDSVFHNGHCSAMIKSVATEENMWRALTQGIRAEKYRGQRIRLSGYMKTQDVASMAGLWLRVDAKNRTLEFDNMSNRTLKGTNNWTLCSVVLDVPKDAVAIFYGPVMVGQGQTWTDDIAIETVDPSIVQTTGWAQAPSGEKDPLTPNNLGFDESRGSKNQGDIPGWSFGDGAGKKEIYLDTTTSYKGKPTVTLHNTNSGYHPISLYQEIRADQFKGHRVAYTTYIKSSQGVAGGPMVAIPRGGQWATAQIPHPNNSGSDWQAVSAVVDVPSWATTIQIGVELFGGGQIWLGESSFKIVDLRMPLTPCAPVEDMYSDRDLRRLAKKPVNLGFEN